MTNYERVEVKNIPSEIITKEALDLNAYDCTLNIFRRSTCINVMAGCSITSDSTYPIKVIFNSVPANSGVEILSKERYLYGKAQACGICSPVYELRNCFFGFIDITRPDTLPLNSACFYNWNGEWRAHTSASSGTTETVITDCNSKVIEVNWTSSSVIYRVNGSTVATHTSNLPQVPLHLGTVARTGSNNGGSGYNYYYWIRI
jgi:hypothetical protein